MTIEALVANVAEGISLGKMGETTVRLSKVARTIRARFPSLNFYAGGRVTFAYKPYSRSASKNKCGRPFFIYCPDLFGTEKHNRKYVDYNDFASHADEAEKILMDYYHVDEKMFELAKKNPYILFPVGVDWHKAAKELGDDFTGINEATGLRRSEIEGRI